jgi:nucleotide-binding universal stress UspA family protein
MVTLRKLLFPTDFSEASEVAWPYAMTLAEQFGAEMIFLHVVPEGAGEVHFVAGFPCGYRPTNMAGWSHDHLRRDVMSKASGSKVPVTPRVREGLASWEIVKEAREAGADMIVMGTHGRAGLAHLLRGSVAEVVVREAPCPVITVRQAESQRGLWGWRSLPGKTAQPGMAQQSRGDNGSPKTGGSSSKHPSGRAPWASAAR